MSKSVKPWLKKNGDPLTPSRLRKISRGWDTKTWSDFANSMEHGLLEYLPEDFEMLLDTYDQKESLRSYYVAECKVAALERSGKQFEQELSKIDPNSLAEALSDLLPLEREVLMLTFSGGKTQREIAKCVEHSRGKIRKVYLRAMRKMRTQMKEKLRNFSGSQE